MKKKYFEPQMRVFKISPRTLLVGSNGDDDRDYTDEFAYMTGSEIKKS